ncbi:MAG: peptide chain release factor aRF-1 [Candidatus Micrarchaeota archaeon]|nr:peptide chain release factor aRF-1 [Candidatus Micrarchaeota archaeon]
MKQEYSLLREIKRLKSIRGSGTQLVSVYIPAGYQLSEEISRLRNEYSTSSNIKSKQTRTNVLGAIDKILQYLKLYRETPKNGLVVFAGNIADDQSKSDIQLFSMEPPEPLKVNIYRCDSTFVLDPIEAMVESKDTYVMVVLDGREATIATLRGTHVQVVKKVHSNAHAKMKKGGQSANRFKRAIEESIEAYYGNVSDTINDIFLQGGFKEKGLIVGGPGPAKENFVRAKGLNYQVKVLGVYDTGYTDETGLNELLEKAADLLKEQEAAQERQILEKFMREVASGGLAIYGYDKTKAALEKKQAGTLILNNELELYKVTYRCSSCGQTIERMEVGEARQAKHEDGGTLTVVDAKDAIEELIELADQNGAETVFVSSESSLGKEFIMGFKGVGALLRYK